MKIIYIIQGLYNSAGMERVVINKANYFSNKGHDVYIITTDQLKRTPYFYLSPQVKMIDLNINFFEYSQLNPFFKVFSFSIKYLKYRVLLSKTLRNISADYVITLMFKNLLFLYKIKDGSKKIVELHFCKYVNHYFSQMYNKDYFSKLIYNIWDKFQNRSLGKYDKFVLLTHEDAIDWGKELSNICVIPNSIQIQSLFYSDLNSNIVISIGRLDYQKGYDYLIPLWSQIKKECPEYVLHIYGSGKEIENLNCLIRKYGVEKSVFIFDPVKNIQGKLLNSVLYLMTSRFEGLPMALLEAMSLGIPAVAFACKCGPSDIINDGIDGYLIPEGNNELFIKRTVELLSNKSKRIEFGLLARKNMQRFSEESVMEKWNNLFVELKK